MNSTAIALISGLISSLATIFFTNYFELIKNKKQHRYSIEKLYFEKKVNAAELIVSQLSYLSGAIMHCSILLERLKEKNHIAEENLFEANVNENLESTINKQLKQAENSTFIISNTLMLYFDIDIDSNTSFAKETAKQIHNLIGKTGEKIDAIYSAYDYYQKVINTIDHNKAVSNYEAATIEYKKHIQDTVEKYETFYEQLLTQIKIIRKDIAKYEVE
jgi:hypothetical protein